MLLLLCIHKSICIALWLGVLAAGLCSNPSQKTAVCGILIL